MGLVATLLPNPLRLARLRTALKDQYSVVTCTDWAELLRTCERQPVGIAVVDLYASGPVSTGFEWLRQLRRRFPSVTLALYVSVPPAQPKELFEAGRFGVESLIVADQDDVPVRLLGLIEQTEARGVLELVRREVGYVRPIVRD